MGGLPKCLPRRPCYVSLVRTLLLCLSVAVLSSACGGGEPEGEATWETHTTVSDDTSGGDAADAEPATDPAPAE